MPAATDVAIEAQAVLQDLAGPSAVLREDQLAAIDALVSQHRRVLLVQATGWGKSAVYFIATLLLRQRGAGPTLLVSPLLALMRDQVAAASRSGRRRSDSVSTEMTVTTSRRLSSMRSSSSPMISRRSSFRRAVRG